ncbi:hypothetical protein U1701_01415 [Sphingomonas sp. PB2P19]|uniref:hypothetical protein n=1 Tax=Sphingomonas rhamnosi TaxID=3096156 RepID=UPI002FC93DC1
MPRAEKTDRLCVARDQLMPVLMILDDCEEHHIAAMLSTALDTLEARIAAHDGPGGGSSPLA